MMSTDLQRVEDLLNTFITTARESSFFDVRTLQHPPHGSLAYGASGVVSVLLHHGIHTGNTVSVEAAKQWMRGIAASRAQTLLRTPTTGDRYNRSSLWFGVLGIHFVRFLTALADPGRAKVSRAVRNLAEKVAAVVTIKDVPDLVLGATGNLIALNLVQSVLTDRTVLEQHSEQLATQVAASMWADEDNWSFAHGWPGMAFALLQWAQLLDREPPDALVERLRSLASVPERSDLDSTLRYSWCNGVSGQILLWVKAYEVTGIDAFLERARSDAELIPSFGTNHMLCCGTPGWAYAFLALDRVDRGAGWHERAVHLCARIIDSNPRFEHASGLLKGYSGVAYLASDLMPSTRTRGFPFIEALPTHPA